MPNRLRRAWPLLRRAVLAGVCAWLAGPAEATDAAACPPPAHMPAQSELVQAAQRARDRGLLWRIERDDKVSWLYGTIHVGKLEWAFPGPTIAAALRQARSLALELDVGSAEVQQQIAAMRTRPDAQRRDPALPAALGARMRQQIAAACLDPNQMSDQPPVLQAVTLAVLSARGDGLDPAYAQEFALAGFMRARGVPVHSLETPAGQLDALGGGSEAEQLALVAQTLEQLDNGKARATLLRLARAWDDGDFDTLARYEQWCDCAHDAAERALLARVNDERNPALADGIAVLHEHAAPVFAAVGALHMTGEQSLPALLRRRGFSVERIR